jgi:hypothetical protein
VGDVLYAGKAVDLVDCSDAVVSNGLFFAFDVATRLIKPNLVSR